MGRHHIHIDNAPIVSTVVIDAPASATLTCYTQADHAGLWFAVVCFLLCLLLLAGVKLWDRRPS